MTDTDERTVQTVRDQAVRGRQTVRGMVDVVLEGGPAGLPWSWRIRYEPDDVDTIKVPYYGGYEHFHRAPGHAAPAVFRWAMRTRVAE